jgi:chromosome segregation ATPase
VQTELSVKSRDIESRDSTIAELRTSRDADLKRIELARSELLEENWDLQSRAKALHATVQSLTAELSAVKAEGSGDLAELQARNQSLQKEKDELRHSIPIEVGALSVELAELRNAVQELKVHNSELTEKGRGLDPRELFAELQKLKADVEQAKLGGYLVD